MADFWILALLLNALAFIESRGNRSEIPFIFAVSIGLKYKNETVGVKQRNHVLIKKRSFCQKLKKMDPLLLQAD